MPYWPVLRAYSFFFSGSGVLEGEEALGAELLAPPLAEPEGLFAASLEPDPLAEELDEPEAGGVAGGVAVAPPEPPMEAEPDVELGALDVDEGGVLGEVAVLELDEPGVEALLELSAPRSQAARPKASATAAANIESFMGPPWLGHRTSEQIARPA